MCEIDELYRRITQIDAELKDVLREAGHLQRALRHKLFARFGLTFIGTLLVASCWTLASGAPAATSSSVRAPFEVDDASNKPIFQVSAEPREFVVYTAAGDRAIIGSAKVDDTSLLVSPTPKGASVKLGISGAASGSSVGQPPPKQQPPKKTRGTKKASGGGQTAGQTSKGDQGGGGTKPSFTFKVGAGSGSERIVMSVEGGKPVFIMRNTKGVPVFYLLQGLAFPGGELALFNSSAKMAVRAGSSAAGIGRVEAFPLGNPIGSFIVGRDK
jgi:hypothetical protein